MTTVLLHPVGLDGESWALTNVAGDRFVYPGHGGRPLPPGGYSLAAIADEIAGRYVGLLDLVGISMGSNVAQYVAIRHPGRVRSLVLIASPAPRTPTPGNQPSAVHEQRAQDVLHHGTAGTAEGTLTRWFTPEALGDPDHPGVRYAKRRWLANDPAAVAAAWRVNGSAATLHDLPAIAAPVTVVAASRDAAAGPRSDPVATGQLMASLLQRARLVVIPAPHMAHLECPAAVAEAVEAHFDWLASTEARSGRIF